MFTASFTDSWTKNYNNMARSKSILELKRKALAMGLCGEYGEKWADAATQKELVDLASDINGADFLCSSVAKGWGLSKDFLLRNFGDYINGRYVSRHGGTKGYTSEVFIGCDGEIRARATILIILYSNVTVYVPENHACRVFAAGNTNIAIQCDGYCEFTDYTPQYDMKAGDFGRVRIIDPKKDKNSWLNFGGNDETDP